MIMIYNINYFYLFHINFHCTKFVILNCVASQEKEENSVAIIYDAEIPIGKVELRH